jgi:hypothetical protein
MSSRKSGADARTKKAAQLFMACEGNPNPTGRLSIPDVIRLRGYSHDEAVNRTLQMQVRQEVEKLKGNASTSALAVISAANAMITLASTNVTRLALVSISQEESNDPSPLKKLRKSSHQRQIDPQNERKGKDAYALALSWATMLIAAEREQEKENTRPTATVITQVEGEFKARGFAVKLTKSTVNRYIRRDMVGTAPLTRGYEGIIPKAVFKLLVLAVESFIQIKQVNYEVIPRKQLLVVLNIRSSIMSHITFKMCQFVLIIFLRDYHYDFDLDIVVLWTCYGVL